MVREQKLLVTAALIRKRAANAIQQKQGQLRRSNSMEDLHIFRLAEHFSSNSLLSKQQQQQLAAEETFREKEKERE